MIVERRGWVTNVRIGPTGNRMSPHIWTEGGSLQIGGTSRMSREAHVRSCERLWVKLPGPTRPFVWGSERSQFASCDCLGNGEGVSPQHIGVLMAERRQPRFVFGTHVVPFGAELIEHRVHIK